MNAITQFLLAGAALGALATAPAMAGDAPDLHLTALHGGNAVGKTRVRNPARQNLTYTFSIYTSISSSEDYRKKIKFPVNYKWNGATKSKFKVAPKKTECAKIGKYSETYSTANGGSYVVYGATYKLTNPHCVGETDHFVSTLIGWFQNNGVKYKGTLNMDYAVAIGE